MIAARETDTSNQPDATGCRCHERPIKAGQVIDTSELDPLARE
jgi:hypothetical protein